MTSEKECLKASKNHKGKDCQIWWQTLPLTESKDETQRFLTKLNIHPLYSPTISLLKVIYPREMKTHAHRKTGTRMFIAILSMVAKTWNKLHCPSTGERINILRCIYTTAIYSAIKNLHNNMDESYSIILSKKPDTLTVWLNLYKVLNQARLIQYGKRC